MKSALIACEFSGIVRDEFQRVGAAAMSCDLLDTERELGPNGCGPAHYKGDVFRCLSEPDLEFDIMIAHPPCTFLTNAGVRWLYFEGRKENGIDKHRWMEMEDACAFVNKLLDAPIEQIGLENPIPHCFAAERIKAPYTQIIQPWMFGEWETKATCLWLKNLPKLIPTYKTVNECREALGETGKPKPRVHHASPGPDRWKERSRTLPGVAKAMAEQWGR